MGSQAAAAEEEQSRGSTAARANMGDLPESCVAHVLALTSPRDACRCAAVSPTFRDAAGSDAVWARFLPPDYRALLPPPARSSKKEAYLGLADSAAVLMEDGGGGGMAVWLAKGSGGKCVALSARRLCLPWDDGELCWRWTPHPLSSSWRKVAKGMFGRADGPSSQRSRDAAAGMQSSRWSRLFGSLAAVGGGGGEKEEKRRWRRRKRGETAAAEEKRPRNLGGTAQEDPQGMAGVQISEEDWLRRIGVISEEERRGISRRNRSSCELRRRKMAGRRSGWPAARGGGGAARVGKK